MVRDYIYKNDKSYVARVSRLVEQAATQGDTVAIKILHDNALPVSKQVEVVAKTITNEKGEQLRNW